MAGERLAVEVVRRQDQARPGPDLVPELRRRDDARQLAGAVEAEQIRPDLRRPRPLLVGVGDLAAVAPPGQAPEVLHDAPVPVLGDEGALPAAAAPARFGRRAPPFPERPLVRQRMDLRPAAGGVGAEAADLLQGVGEDLVGEALEVVGDRGAAGLVQP